VQQQAGSFWRAELALSGYPCVVEIKVPAPHFRVDGAWIAGVLAAFETAEDGKVALRAAGERRVVDKLVAAMGKAAALVIG
jgi:hypothetical protein